MLMVEGCKNLPRRVLKESIRLDLEDVCLDIFEAHSGEGVDAVRAVGDLRAARCAGGREEAVEALYDDRPSGQADSGRQKDYPDPCRHCRKARLWVPSRTPLLTLAPCRLMCARVDGHAVCGAPQKPCSRRNS